MSEKIFIDTNIFLSIFELKQDLLEEIESKYGKNNLITSNIVIEELKNKQKKGKMALTLIEKRNIQIEKFDGDLKADNAILEHCKQKDYVLATNDRELLIRAKQKHLKTIRIRQNIHLI